MIGKITIYISIVFFVIILEREFKILSQIGIEGNIFFLFLLSIYLLLLFLEIKSKINKGLTLRKVRNKGFIFSFWVGVIWGILISFYRGVPKFVSPYLIFIQLIGYGMAGVLMGLIGMGITIIFWNYISRDGSQKT